MTTVFNNMSNSNTTTTTTTTDIDDAHKIIILWLSIFLISIPVCMVMWCIYSMKGTAPCNARDACC